MAHTGQTWPAPGPAPAGSALGSAAATEARLAALRARQAPVQAGKPTGTRKGPASGAKAASLALSTLATVGLAGMFAQNAEAGSTITLATPATITATQTATQTATNTATNTATQTATQSAAGTTATTAAAAAAATRTTGQIVDGTYVGAADRNRWGTVQVQAVYSGGQLVDVQILSYPDGDSKSVRINQRALPTLIERSIADQSADVSTVSGATYTSDSYVASLQSAIDAARSASGLA